MAHPPAPTDCTLELKISSPRPEECYERKVRLRFGEARVLILALTFALKKIFRDRQIAKR
jgi:hypothetical protein